MKDTHNHNFEEEFRKAFEEVEATPSPKLWAEIDAHLANNEASRYKRKLYYFKWSAAAASVALVCSFSIWLFTSQFIDSKSELATTAKETSIAKDLQTTGNSSASSAVNSTSDAQVLAQQSASESLASSPGAAKESAIGKETNSVAANTGQNKNINGGIPSAAKNALALADQQEKSEGIEKNTTDKKTKPAESSVLLNQNQIVAKESVTTSAIAARKAKEELSQLKEKAINKPSNEAKQHSVLSGPVSEQTLAAVRNFDSYRFNRLNNQLQPSDQLIKLKAPAVSIKASNAIWIEEEKEARSTASKWSVGLAFAPTQFNPNMEVSQTATSTLSNAKNSFYSNSQSAPLGVGNIVQNGKVVGKELENSEGVNLSYNVGVSVQYALSEKLSLQSGVQYLYNNSQIATDNYLENRSNQDKYPEFMTFISPASDPVSFSVISDPATINKSSDELALAIAERYTNTYPGVTEVLVYNTYQYVSIPLRLHYKIFDKKVSTSVGAGLAADIFMKNTIGNPSENIANQEITRSNNSIYKDVGMSGLLSAKVDYKLSSRYSIYIEPSYRAALSSFTRTSMVSSRPSSFGLGTGFLYRF